MTALVVKLPTCSEKSEIELVLDGSSLEAIYVFNVRHIAGQLFSILESEIISISDDAMRQTVCSLLPVSISSCHSDSVRSSQCSWGMVALLENK